MLPILNLGCEENWRGGNGKMMILLQENKKTTQNKKAKKRKSKFFISRQFYTSLRDEDKKCMSDFFFWCSRTMPQERYKQMFWFG
jgi:hypothetical protein